MQHATLALSLIAVCLGLILSVLYVMERLKFRRMIRFIAVECGKMGELLGTVAYGCLDQFLEAPENVPAGAKAAVAALDLIRNNINIITGEPLQRVCYVGTDAWLEGKNCALTLGQKLGGKGRVTVIIASNLSVLIMAQRYRSFITTLKDRYPDIRITECFEAMSDQERARGYAAGIAQHVEAIYITGNSAAPGIAQGIRATGRAGLVYVLCHDIDGNIAALLQDGSISATLVSSTIAQGRDPVIHLYNHLTSGWKPLQPRLLSTLELVDAANLHHFWDFANDRLLESGSIHDTGIVPLKFSEEPIRIAVLLEDWNSMFKQIIVGIKMAESLLKPYNATVIMYPLNQVRKTRDQVVREFEDILAREHASGLNGLVACIHKVELVPLLNTLVRKGLPVVTYNSEPLGLRSMISWVATSSGELGRFCEDYERGHQEINSAMQNVLDTIQRTTDRISQEALIANNGAKAVEELLHLIDSTNNQERQQLTTVSGTTEVGTSLSEMVGFFNSKIQGLQRMSDMVRESGTKIDSMNTYSERITSIIGLINDIADQTNLLAFNATIEATRAGQTGKGFKVIADAIRLLADKSVDSTRSVSKLIGEMKLAIHDSITSVDSTRSMVDEQVLSVTAASGQLKELTDKLLAAVQTARNAADHNMKDIESMRESAYLMSQIIADSSSMAEENDFSMETLAQTFTEISAQFSEMNRQTRQLSHIFSVLDDSISQFNTNGAVNSRQVRS